MSTEANFERGIQLFDMGRYKEAIPYLNNALASDIDNFETKFLLAQAHLQLDNLSKAKDLAIELRSNHPNFSGVHYLLSQINFIENNIKEALGLIDEAIGLEPYNEGYFGHKAFILLHQKKFEEALFIADQGLKINAKSRSCLNARASALTKLNRKNEAKETIENILNDNPENAYSHANVGWSHLEHNDIKKALIHFKEALKLDPNDEYARNGMITAVKAKNKIYNLYLRYAFWIGNISEKNQWVFIIGLYLVYRFSLKILTFSGLTILAVPLIIAYLLIALGSWIMEPLSNMILLFDKFGKYLLDHNSKLCGQIFFSLLMLSLVAFTLNFIINSDYLILFSIAALAAILPLSRSALNPKRNTQRLGYIYGLIILLIPIAGGVLGYEFSTLLIVILVMFIAYTWLGNIIFN